MVGKQVWKRFCDTLFSDEEIQRKRVLAVILDGQVYELINAHTMLESNLGDITISGNFDQIRQQKDWARILTTGPIPARLHFDRMTSLGK
ncbi:MAG: hypothetical protein IH987_15465 [Planctomycetes bacterium]|nr:hypothetical protein [Planctomycetota bacterium]